MKGIWYVTPMKPTWSLWVIFLIFSWILLKVFYWELLGLCSSERLAHNFLLPLDLCLGYHALAAKNKFGNIYSFSVLWDNLKNIDRFVLLWNISGRLLHCIHQVLAYFYLGVVFFFNHCYYLTGYYGSI